MSHEQVVASLTRDTVQYRCSVGFGGGQFECGEFAQYVNITVKAAVRMSCRGG
jgi:hypothetical protein